MDNGSVSVSDGKMIRCALLACGLILAAGCTKKTPGTAPAAAPAAPAAPAKPAVPPRNPDLDRIAKLSHQADQIAREAWWVATSEKLGVERSPFGKLKRAALMALDGRLSSKGRFACDRYLVVPLPGLAKNFEISEFCNTKAAPKKFAAWTITGPHSAKVEFEPANLGEVLGLGASIFSKRFSCELVWTDSDVLDSMKCPHWEQDRGNSQVVSWQTFDFHRGAGNVLMLRGKVLENLQAVRKIEADVPLAGKIVVTETVTQAPPEEKKPPEAKKQAAQASAPLPPPPPGTQLYNGQPPEVLPPDHGVSGGPAPAGPGMDMVEGAPVYIPPVVADPGRQMPETQANPAAPAIPETPVDPATGLPLSPRRAVDPDLMRQQGTLPPPPPPPVWTDFNPEAVAPNGGVEYSPNPADSGGSHGQDVQGQGR